MTVDQFVEFVSACGNSPLLEQLRAEWHRREGAGNPNFPHQLRWAEWCYQVDTIANAKRAGTPLDLL